MHTDLAAAAVNCHTGSWLQQWKCGWDHPAITTGGIGFDFGHYVLPWLLLLALVLLVARAVTKRKAHNSPAPVGAGRARARARR